MKTTIKPTKKHAAKIAELLQHGLSSGLGEPIPGQMCVEAAVCFALGLPHSDDPKCVGSAVRAFKIQLNDCNWSSNKARGDGMKYLAIAQLSSDTLDQVDFAKRLALATTKRLLPVVLRQAAEKQSEPHKAKMLEMAIKCENSKDLSAAADAARAAAYAADAADAARAAAAADAAYAADAAAADAARAAADAADAADAARAAADAADAARAADATKDQFLLLIAEIALDVLKEMKSPGCKWLDVVK